MDVDEYERIADAEDEHWWYVATRALMASVLADVPAARVLDAGCGPGGNGAWLQEKGTVFGFDLAAEAVDLAARRHPEMLVARGNLLAVPFASSTFDLVVGVTVINQVADDDLAVGELVRVVRPGGTILLIEPAFQSLRRSHDRVVHTHKRYRRGELRVLLEHHGVLVTRATYAHSYLVPAAAGLAVFDRLRPDRRTSDVSRGGPSKVLSALARAERAVLRSRDLPIGLSALVVGTKT